MSTVSMAGRRKLLGAWRNCCNGGMGDDHARYGVDYCGDDDDADDDDDDEGHDADDDHHGPRGWGERRREIR